MRIRKLAAVLTAALLVVSSTSMTALAAGSSTTSGSHSGGGGSHSSGGGSSSGGPSGSGNTNAGNTNASATPSGAASGETVTTDHGSFVVTGLSSDGGVTAGTWGQTDDGTWYFAENGKAAACQWLLCTNPYASGEHAQDWFFFNADGKMLTGWQLINGYWFYLNTVSDGTLGRCVLNSVVDGRQLDAQGYWVVNGVRVQG